MPKEIQICVVDAGGASENIFAYQGNTLASALLLNGWELKNQTDANWKVLVRGGNAGISSGERKKLTPEELEQGIRRADLYKIEEPVQVHLHAGYIRKNIWGSIAWEQVPEDLPWTYMNIYLPGRQMNLPGVLQETEQALYDRIVSALQGYHILLEPQELRELAFIDRLGRPVIELQALINSRRREVYALLRKQNPMAGAVVSLEADTVTVLLVDLKSGQTLEQYTETSILYERLSELAEKNPSSQKKYTENLMAELHQILRKQVQKIMDAVLERHENIRSRDIYRTVIMGQTALLHVFMNIPPVDISTPGLHALFYQSMQLCPQGQVPQMNPWGEYIVLQQWGHLVGSDALAAALALYTENPEPVLMVQPAAGGQVSLKIGKKIWVTESFQHVPDVSLLQAGVGKLMASAGIRMEKVNKVYVVLPSAQEVLPVQEKLNKVLSRIGPEKIYYMGAAHFIGGKMALLSESFRKKMNEIQKRSIFLM